MAKSARARPPRRHSSLRVDAAESEGVVAESAIAALGVGAATRMRGYATAPGTVNPWLTSSEAAATMAPLRGPERLAIVAIIPARFGSTRLPGKPLADIHGKTMIERVHERVRGATTLDRILVATDDERIAAAVRGFGGEVRLTSPAHLTGTGRPAEAARSVEAEIVVNVQGDEPMLDPAGIDAAVRALKDDPELEEIGRASCRERV